jgi:hypothetical protein
MTGQPLPHLFCTWEGEKNPHKVREMWCRAVHCRVLQGVPHKGGIQLDDAREKTVHASTWWQQKKGYAHLKINILECTGEWLAACAHDYHMITLTLTPWLESVGEPYRPSDHRLSAKLVPTFADRECHVVSITDPYGHIPGFSRPEPLLFLPSSSPIALTRLSVACSRPTTSQKIW